jgi:hypothetical protein
MAPVIAYVPANSVRQTGQSSNTDDAQALRPVIPIVHYCTITTLESLSASAGSEGGAAELARPAAVVMLPDRDEVLVLRPASGAVKLPFKEQVEACPQGDTAGEPNRRLWLIRIRLWCCTPSLPAVRDGLLAEVLGERVGATGASTGTLRGDCGRACMDARGECGGGSACTEDLRGDNDVMVALLAPA